jgi:hypothetical protein
LRAASWAAPPIRLGLEQKMCWLFITTLAILYVQQ